MAPKVTKAMRLPAAPPVILSQGPRWESQWANRLALLGLVAPQFDKSSRGDQAQCRWVCDVSGGPFQFAATKPGATPLGLEEAHRDLRISPASHAWRSQRVQSARGQLPGSCSTDDQSFS
jgi:hypothetical protein